MIRFKSHNVGSLQLPTLGNYRRVHNDGLLMLDNHYNLKEMEDKAKIMENRLKRLNDQEAKAIKNQKIAEKKASDMLLARGRHYNDMMNKMRFMHEKNAQLEDQRRRNKELRDGTKFSVAKSRQQLYNKNYISKLNQHDEMTYNQQFNDVKLQELRRQRDQWRSVMSHKLELKEYKKTSQVSVQNSVMQNYNNKMNDKRDKTSTLANKINMMEQKEQELLERLQVTQNKQKQAYSSLENMVNVGYNYYAQCYELKKKKQKELVPMAAGFDNTMPINSKSAQSL